MKYFRRSFLIILGLAAAAGFSALRWWEAARHLLFPRTSEPAAPSPEPSAGNRPPRQGKARLSLVRGDDPEDMVQRAVDLLGGWGRIGIKGKTVLVKPNVVSGRGPPATTSPEVVGAVVRSLYRAGAAQVSVGDMSALMALPTRENMEKTGIAAAAGQAGAELVFFEDQAWKEVPVERARHLDSVLVSEPMITADRIVNLPVVKTHHSAVYSVALKNFVGATHGRQRPYVIDAGNWEEVVAELNLAYRPHLNIVDATSIMVSGGPWEGQSRSPGLIIASPDRIAADLAGLALIKGYGLWPQVAEADIWSQRQIRKAVELGLGVSSPDGIQLLAEDMSGDAEGFAEMTGKIRRFMGLA